MDERPQPSCRPAPRTPSAAYCASGQVARDLDDAGQHPVQRQVGGHRHDGVEQEPQALLLVECALDPAQHLTQQVVEVRVGERRQSPR